MIRGELAQVGVVGGSIDPGNVACVGDNVTLDRVTDLSADPSTECGGTACLIYLARNDGDSDFGCQEQAPRGRR